MASFNTDSYTLPMNLCFWSFGFKKKLEIVNSSDVTFTDLFRYLALAMEFA